MKKPGNPNISQYHYQAAGDEPLNKLVNVKVSENTQIALKGVEGWQDRLRLVIGLVIAGKDLSREQFEQVVSEAKSLTEQLP